MNELGSRATLFSSPAMITPKMMPTPQAAGISLTAFDESKFV
jgi:hypothetical protein